MELLIVCILVLAMCVLSLLQKNKSHKLAAGVFSLSCAVHLVFFNDIESDTLYYLSDGICNVIALVILCFICKPFKFTDNIIYACIASLLLNFYGLTIYGIGIGPMSYNMTFYALYSYVIFLMTRNIWNGHNVLARFRLSYSECDPGCYPLHKEAK